MERTEKKSDVLALYGVMLLTAVTGTMIGAATPAFTQRLGLTYSQVGLLGSAQGVGGLIAIALGGALSDRCSKAKLVLAGFLAYALAVCTLGLESGYAVLLGGVLLVCMLSNLLSLVISAYFAEQPNGESRLNYGHALFSLGSLVGPLWFALCNGWSHGVTISFVAVGAVCLVFCAPCATLASSASVPQQREKGALVRLLRQPALRRLCLACIFFMGQQTAVSSLGASYFAAKWSGAHGELMLTLYWTGVMVGRFLQPFVNRRLSSEKYLAATCALSAVALAVALQIDSESVLTVVLTLCAIGTGAAFPTLIALGSQACPRHAGLATTLVCLAGTIGGMIAPALVGWLSQAFDAQTGMLVVPLFLLASALCLPKGNGGR